MFIHQIHPQPDGRYAIVYTGDDGRRYQVYDAAFCCHGEHTTIDRGQTQIICVYFESTKEPIRAD